MILAKLTPELDMHNIKESGLGNTPMVELSLARHFSPFRCFTNNTSASLPRKAEHFTASVFQRTCKALNVTSLLLAYFMSYWRR